MQPERVPKRHSAPAVAFADPADLPLEEVGCQAARPRTRGQISKHRIRAVPKQPRAPLRPRVLCRASQEGELCSARKLRHPMV
eukprot:178855-Amphidinium_carterae.1